MRILDLVKLNMFSANLNLSRIGVSYQWHKKSYKKKHVFILIVNFNKFKLIDKHKVTISRYGIYSSLYKLV